MDVFKVRICFILIGKLSYDFLILKKNQDFRLTLQMKHGGQANI